MSKATAMGARRESRIDRQTRRKKMKKLARFLSQGHSQRTCAMGYRIFVSKEMIFFQLEIPFLLPLYQYDLIRTPQVARYRFSLELHPQFYDSNNAPSLFAEEHLCSGQPGEVPFGGGLQARH